MVLHQTNAGSKCHSNHVRKSSRPSRWVVQTGQNVQKWIKQLLQGIRLRPTANPAGVSRPAPAGSPDSTSAALTCRPHSPRRSRAIWVHVLFASQGVSSFHFWRISRVPFSSFDNRRQNACLLHARDGHFHPGQGRFPLKTTLSPRRPSAKRVVLLYRLRLRELVESYLIRRNTPYPRRRRYSTDSQA